MTQCPAPGCERLVDEGGERLACRSHWYAIPAELRVAVWVAYLRAGPGTERHRLAVAAAVGYLRARYGRTDQGAEGNETGAPGPGGVPLVAGAPLPPPVQ